MIDSTQGEIGEATEEIKQYIDRNLQLPPITLVKNKCDLTGDSPSIEIHEQETVVTLSASDKTGLDILKRHLKDAVGFKASESGTFMARRRHIDALNRADNHLQTGYEQLTQMAAGEILAEELKLTQDCLNEITGEFTSDDLLGKIFSSFCIGK